MFRFVCLFFEGVAAGLMERFVLEKSWQGRETLIAFNSLHRMPCFALESGLS